MREGAPRFSRLLPLRNTHQTVITLLGAMAIVASKNSDEFFPSSRSDDLSDFEEIWRVLLILVVLKNHSDPAAVASLSWDSDVLSVLVMSDTFGSSKSLPIRMRPVSRWGDWWCKKGVSFHLKIRRFNEPDLSPEPPFFNA
jgi:hypothetical protein